MSSKDEMSFSVNVNGQSKVPPGFRFHPTEEELLHYYLRKKVAYEKIDLDVIHDVDLNKLEPWDIQEKCRIGSTPQNDWYFFSHKDKKYPTGTRTNRATAAGFWKATGRDKVIYSSFRRIGMRKTLVFYKGRAPHGQKSDWIMHEYRLDDDTVTTQDYGSVPNLSDPNQEEGWVVCRVFKKKNYHKSLESPQRSSSSAPSIDSNNPQMQSLNNKDIGTSAHDHFLVYIGSTKSCKKEMESLANITTTTTTNDYNPIEQLANPINDDRFLHLPKLDNTTTMATSAGPFSSATFDQDSSFQTHNHNWADLDRLVASQLNGQVTNHPSKQMYQDHMCFALDHHDQEPEPEPQPHTHGGSMATRPPNQGYTNDIELWSFAQSSSQSSSPDPFYHLSV